MMTVTDRARLSAADLDKIWTAAQRHRKRVSRSLYWMALAPRRRQGFGSTGYTHDEKFSALYFYCEQFGIERGAARRCGPGHVRRHAVLAHARPLGRIGPQCAAAKRAIERILGDRAELNSGRRPALGSSRSMIVSASPPTRATTGSRHSAARRLRQAARLEPRRHQQRVGPGLDQMGEVFVIADVTATVPGYWPPSPAALLERRGRRCPAPPAALRCRAAGAAAARRSTPFCQVSASPPRTAAVRIAAGQSAAAARACSDAGRRARIGRSVRGIVWSVAGFHTATSIPLRMPQSTLRAPQERIEPGPFGRRLDLRRVGRRDGRDAIGKLQPGLEEADAAVILDAVDREGPARARRSVVRSWAGNRPWKARL